MFSLLNVAAKALTGDLPVMELLWARTAGHLAFVVAAFGPRHGRRLFATHHPAFQLTRSLLLLGSTAFNFVALRHIGLATAATINFTAPCIVALLAVPLLGERVGAPALGRHRRRAFSVCSSWCARAATSRRWLLCCRSARPSAMRATRS